MTPEEEANLTIVKAAYERHAFFAAADENTVLREAPSLPYGGEYRGVAAMQRLAQRMRATWGRPGADGKSDPTLHREVEYTVDGDMVCAHMMFSGTGEKTGKSFSFPVVEVFRFRAGVIVDITVFYFDTQQAVDCFG
jgi:ketosteroid isomerase-like protein